MTAAALRRRLPAVLLLLLLAAAGAPAGAQDPGHAHHAPASATGAEGAAFDSHQAFEVLKTLAGTWNGEGHAEHGGEVQGPFPGSLEFRVSAGGTVVMETMFPGTGHEMINMYHLDGDDLVLTHYCSSGNQPTMKLAAGATPQSLAFDFTGGTNLDPAKDGHIHSARLELLPDGALKSSWVGYENGAPASEMAAVVRRGDG